METPNISIWTKDGDWDRNRATIYCDNNECRYYQPPVDEDTEGTCDCKNNQFVVNPDSLIECSVMFE